MKMTFIASRTNNLETLAPRGFFGPVRCICERCAAVYASDEALRHHTLDEPSIGNAPLFCDCGQYLNTPFSIDDLRRSFLMNGRDVPAKLVWRNFTVPLEREFAQIRQVLSEQAQFFRDEFFISSCCGVLDVPGHRCGTLGCTVVDCSTRPCTECRIPVCARHRMEDLCNICRNVRNIHDALAQTEAPPTRNFVGGSASPRGEPAYTFTHDCEE